MLKTFNLDSQALKEFKRLYFREFGEELDDSAARILAENFLIVMDAITRGDQ